MWIMVWIWIQVTRECMHTVHCWCFRRFYVQLYFSIMAPPKHCESQLVFFFFFTNLSLHQICRSFSTWYAFLVEQSLRFWNHTMLFKKFLTYHPFYGSLIHHFIKLKIPSPTSLHRSVACNMRCRFIWTHPQDLRHIWQRLFLYLHLGLTWPRHKLDSDWPPLGHKANALKPSSQWPFTERQILIKLLELSAQANI